MFFTAIATSSSTSRLTHSSRVSPGSTNPAKTLYIWGGKRLACARRIFDSPEIFKGLCWLEKSQQSDDGSWCHDVGITSLAILSFVNYGIDNDFPFISDAVDFLIDNRIVEGYEMLSIYSDPDEKIEQTSQALIALRSLNDPNYYDYIKRMKNFLVSKQQKLDSDHSYGGWLKSFTYNCLNYGLCGHANSFSLDRRS